jgi:hypothetical protein
MSGDPEEIIEYDTDGNELRRIPWDAAPPALQHVLRMSAQTEGHEPVALPDFPDKPGRRKVRFSEQAALAYLDLKEQAGRG